MVGFVAMDVNIGVQTATFFIPIGCEVYEAKVSGFGRYYQPLGEWLFSEVYAEFGEQVECLVTDEYQRLQLASDYVTIDCVGL